MHYLISVLLHYFFFLPIQELQNIAEFPTEIMKTAPLPRQNHGLVFPKPKYNHEVFFASCLQVRKVRLTASYISMNKMDKNCADFLLILVLLLEEALTCVTAGTEPFCGTVLVRLC